jgi:tetratricopeptide (TPR) repeat protein
MTTAGITLSAVILAAALAGAPEDAAPTPRFIDAAASSGLEFRVRNSPTSRKYLIETMGGGVAILDYDNNGWADVFFVNGAALRDPQPDSAPPDKTAPDFWNRLYRNNRDGTFTDVTQQSGLRGAGYGMGVATGDFDNDGFTDLVVTNYGGAILYRNNGNGTFTDVTAAANLKTSGWTAGAAFLDYDNDGRLDLVICRYLEWDFSSGALFCGFNIPGGRAYCHPDEYKPVSNYLFHNEGDGQFKDVSQASRFGSIKGKALGVAIGDYNGDGRLDIYVANDAWPQMLFRNNGDGTFDDVALSAGVAYTEDGHTFSGMGTVFADVDNDGLPDILTTALPYEFYAFFQNAGKGQFRYASVSSGLAAITRPYGGWGIHVFDYDNDGAHDVFVANGHVMDNIEVTQPHLRTLEPPLLLRYTGNRFVDISTDAGEVFQRPCMSRGAAFGDLDNDGDVDIVVSDYGGPAHLLRNEGGNHKRWIGFDLRGTRSNRDAIGAKVTLMSGSGRAQHAIVSTAGSYLSANDRRMFFGLGQEDHIREVRIAWPSGLEQIVQTPASGRVHTVPEPAEPRGSRTDARARFAAGIGLARQGKTAEAIEAFRRAIALDPDLVEAHFSLGVLLARQGRANYGAAMREFLEVLRRNPRDVDARINISNLLEQEGDLNASVAEMRRAVEIAPFNPDLFVMLGNKQHQARMYAEAAGSFRKALGSGRALPRAHYGLGLALKYLRRPAEAAIEFETVLRLNPGDPYAHFELGSVLSQQEQFDKAIEHVRKAASLDPSMHEAWLELGRIYRRQNRLVEAEDAFRRAVRLKPDLVSAVYALARLSDENDPAAAELYARVRELKARSAEAGQAGKLNSEGVAWMEQNRLDDAAAAFRRAIEADPTFAVAAYNLGVALAHKGSTAEAAAAFRTAIGLRAGFRQAHLGLGLMLQLRGERGAAEELRTAQMLQELERQRAGGK